MPEVAILSFQTDLISSTETGELSPADRCLSGVLTPLNSHSPVYGSTSVRPVCPTLLCLLRGVNSTNTFPLRWHSWLEQTPTSPLHTWTAGEHVPTELQELNTSVSSPVHLSCSLCPGEQVGTRGAETEAHECQFRQILILIGLSCII